MRTLIAILVILAFGMNAMAQDVSLGALKEGKTYKNIAADYTLTNTTARNFTIDSYQDYFSAQDLIIQLDSASGDHTNVAVALYGRKSEQTSTWAQIGSTVNWKGTTSDTTIIISNTTEVGYRYFKWTLTGTGTGTTTIDNQEFKLWYGLP